MTPKKPTTVKLTNLAKAMTVAFALPMTALAAEDPNFPELTGSTVMSHKSESGLNLLHNGTVETCVRDIDSDNTDFTADPDSLCNSDIDYMWGFVNYSRSTDTGDGSNYSLNSKLAKGTRKSDPEFVSVTGVTKLYLKADIKVLAAGGSRADRLRIKIPKKTDPTKFAYLNIEAPTAVGDWETLSAEFDLTGNVNFDVPFTGDIAFFMATEDGNEVLIDNVIMFSDVDFANYTPVSDEADEDGDGFSDEAEKAVFSDHTDASITPENANNDGDEYLNTVEIEEGSDPKDPNKTPIDVDGDGVTNSLLSSGSIENGADDYPEDPAVSLDTDGDTYPDSLNDINDSCDQVCLDASDYIIDAFPDEKEAHLDADNDDLADACLVELDGDAPASPELEGTQTCGLTAVPVDYDNDEDGFKNEEEIMGGSNPNDAGSIPTDPDSDGWDNDVDEYDDLNMFSQPTTNLLSAVGFDAEANTTGWSHTANSTIDQTIGRDGETTAAFKIVSDAAENRYEGPLLEIAEEKDAKAFRIGGWIKIEDSLEREALDVLDRIFLRIAVKYHDESISGGAFPGYYANQNSDENKLKLVEVYAMEENNGWLYVESQSLLAGAVKSIAPNLVFKTKAAGPVTLWIDELEVNFAEGGDADAATDTEVMIDAIDSDDDNDDIKDGLDDTPLGDAGTDLDDDEIWDAYDDDHDNDLIANAIDDDFTPLFLSELEVKESNGTYTITANAVDGDDDNLTYRWNVFTTDIAEDGTFTAEETELSESGNSIMLNAADYPPGFQVPITVTAVTTAESIAKQTVISMPGEKLNFIPQIADSEPVADNFADTLSLTADVFDFDEEDTITYQWEINGEVVGSNSADISISNADYAPGTELTVVLTVSDGKDSAMKTWQLVTNRLPEVNIVTTEVDADNTTFSIGYLDEDGTLVLGAQDAEADSFSYLWTMTIDGVEYLLDESEANGREFSINRKDYQAGSVIELTATATDLNRPTHVVSATASISLDAIAADNDGEIYPEGDDGGATWWLIALLVPAFIRRRFYK
ncbi:hypothetical protein [Thalassotalea crassostreae]|uniref:hypothetical protein n=1 Tax=Thalassotalea crassostreae TaxID=1763536 RepID=UPI000838691A|nr:hypothetical protein [Thalassotalea crassostreae]